MASNTIKLRRTRSGLTQRQLAERVGTSQQQIQRIEAGTQAANVDLATKLAAALGCAVHDLFPATRKVRIAGDANLSDPAVDEMEEAGVALDPRQFTLMVRMTGGLEMKFALSGLERKRVFGNVQQREAGGFVVFDTPTERVALNLERLSICHFLFDVYPSGSVVAFTDAPETEEQQDRLQFWFTDGGDRSFAVDRDEDEEDVGNIGGIFFDLETNVGEDLATIHFTDEDGEMAFLLKRDILVCKAPLAVVEPALDEAEMDGWREEGGA